MKFTFAAYMSFAILGTLAHEAWGMESECGNKGTLDFVVLESAANKKSIEDDIRAQLSVVGFDVQSRFWECFIFSDILYCKLQII